MTEPVDESGQPLFPPGTGSRHTSLRNVVPMGAVITGVSCSNEYHPDGAWHVATPLPASWQWIERLRYAWRRHRWGCGCKKGQRQSHLPRSIVVRFPVEQRLRFDYIEPREEQP